jgi:hypothetical protein
MVKTFGEIFSYLGIEEYRILQAHGSNSKTSARSDGSLLKEAYTTGLDVVKTLK